jgi:aspartokinase
VFDVFRSQQVSVDVVASSEVSISLSLDPKKSWSDGEVGAALGTYAGVAGVEYGMGYSWSSSRALLLSCKQRHVQQSQRMVWSHLLLVLLQVGEELNHLIYELEKISSVRVRSGMAILSLICNVERTSEILLRTFKVLLEEGINVSMMSQGASKVRVSLQGVT